jgi:hypothetical protein
MNSFDTLRSAFQCLDNGLSRLSHAVSDDSLVSLSDQMICFAEDLKAKKAERIKDLAENGPRAFFECGELVIVLLREGKEKHICFGEWWVKFASTNDETVRKELGLEGPAEEDGQTYFLNVLPRDFGQSAHGIRLPKAEWLILKEKVAKAELAEFE